MHKKGLFRKGTPTTFTIRGKAGSSVNVRNVWDNGDGVEQSWHGGAAMCVAVTQEGVVFGCNSTMESDACEDLVFVFSL